MKSIIREKIGPFAEITRLLKELRTTKKVDRKAEILNTLTSIEFTNNLDQKIKELINLE